MKKSKVKKATIVGEPVIDASDKHIVVDLTRGAVRRDRG